MRGTSIFFRKLIDEKGKKGDRESARTSNYITPVVKNLIKKRLIIKTNRRLTIRNTILNNQCMIIVSTEWSVFNSVYVFDSILYNRLVYLVSD